MLCCEKYFSVKTFFRTLCGALQADITRHRTAGGDVPGRMTREGCCRGIFVLTRAATALGSMRQPLSLEMLPRPM